MMELHMDGNTTLINSPIGNGTTMHIYGYDQAINTAPYMTNEDWDKLETFIVNEGREKGISDKDVKKILACAKSHDEQGLKKALASDAKGFLLNVLGGVASTGLIAALKELFGMA